MNRVQELREKVMESCTQLEKLMQKVDYDPRIVKGVFFNIKESLEDLDILDVGQILSVVLK